MRTRLITGGVFSKKIKENTMKQQGKPQMPGQNPGSERPAQQPQRKQEPGQKPNWQGPGQHEKKERRG